MALLRARSNEIPKDAVLITEDQAIFYHVKLISNWEKLSEVWALRFSPGLIAAMASASGIFINNHFRRKLKLGVYGRFSTYLPIVVIPAMASLFCHKYFVQRSLFLQPMEGCPICIQLRAAGIQIGFGVVYPTILAPMAACMFATRHFTYRLPSITENPLEVLKLLGKFTKPIIPIFGTIIIGQSLIAIYLTYKEQRQNLNILIKMRTYEQQAEQELGL